MRVSEGLMGKLKKYEVNISEVVRKALEEEVRKKKKERLQELQSSLRILYKDAGGEDS